MNRNPAYPMFGDPNYNPNNLANPYDWNIVDSSRGETYFNAPAANSTMVSDSVEMTKRLKAFVPMSSVKQGRTPQEDLMTRAMKQEENNIGADYKPRYQH